jgi:hypothetical protein
MNNLQEAAQQALEALEHLSTIECNHAKGICTCEYREAATSLRAALAEPAAPTVVEPVAYQWLDTSVIRKRIPKSAEADAWRPLYATPPRAALTVDQIIEATRHIDSNAPGLFVVITRAIEGAHGIGGPRNE